MPRIKIKDLPRNQKISKEEIKMVVGGYSSTLTQSALPVVGFTLDPKVDKLTSPYNAPYFSLRRTELVQ